MSCPYQRGLNCRPSSKCAICGWNPPVHKDRVRELRARRRENEEIRIVNGVRYFNTFGEIVDPAPGKKPDFSKETGDDYPN